ncbi:hypothetical protein ASD65_07200 [Microbacterium sp. Root61]|uniref:molybdenum cofactor guanylyltransferase n=1 Tax=Microbacterium sp. Root61 TaxID=1736570 RepID=UPI0006F27852|nr:NTP transferase domain-containing protein [Microbacterium sp. Root61]KRA24230.1 hypothetical protein ASD65_07200 [Microbacterium sp. Root61]
MDAARGVSLPSCGAILLAGGRATRVDGAAKPLFEVGGTTLLAAAVAAARSVPCAPITVVGPREDAAVEDADALEWLREDPPFGGPAAAIVAALHAWDGREGPLPEWTLVLACDLPRAVDAVAQLMRDLPLLPADTDGVCLADAASRPQWLTAAYRTASLRRAARTIPDGARDASVRALLDDLAITVLRAPDALTADVDTWEDLEDARRRFAARETEQT